MATMMRAKRIRRLVFVALYVAVAVGLLSVNAVSAQGPPRQIEVAATEDFGESLEVDVSLTGMDEFEGGTAAVYLCANADATGNAIVPTAADCIAPGTDGYVFGTIENGSYETTYPLQLEGIGANGATCVLPEEDQLSCQVVVATTMGGEAKITGVPLDGLLAQLSLERIVEAGQLPSPETDAAAEVLGSVQIEELAETGLSRDLTMMLLLGSGVAIYLGYLITSAAWPVEDDYMPAHARP